MSLSNRKTIIALSALLGLFIGTMIPLVFAFIDISELGMNITRNNLLEIINSQKVYTFSAVAFPILFMGLFISISQLASQKRELTEGKLFTNNVLNSIDDYLFTVDKQYKLAPQNKDSDTQKSTNVMKEVMSHESFLNLVNNRRDSYELKIESKSYLVNFHASLEESSLILGIITLKDITSLKEQQEVIDRKNKELEVNSRLSAIGEIASGVAHEINNPLAIIQGNVSLVINKFKRGKPVDEVQLTRCENKISDNIDRIANIIKNLRDLTRVDDSQKTTTINEAITKSMPLITSITKSHSIEFSHEVNVDGDSTIDFNPIDFTQIIMNLVKNSKDALSDYKFEQRWIKLIVENDTDNNIVFKVIDSGSGIEDEIVDKIFNPLFTTKDFGAGSGLGLSLSMMLASKNSSTLSYEKGEHTTFVLRVKSDSIISREEAS